MSGERDLLIVGGGITGLSLAVHAARLGLATTLVEAGELGGVSTQRSGALVRAHYDDEASARLARRGVEHFAGFDQIYGGSAGFRATGFAYVPTVEEVGSGRFSARVGMLRRAGVETELVGAEELAAIDPAIDLADVGIAAYEPTAGHAEPALTTATLARAAREAGAELRERAVVSGLLRTGPERVGGVTIADDAPIVASRTVLCAGAWSADLARPFGVEPAIRPTAVKLAFFERRVAMHLTVIDAPGGIYLRPFGDHATLVGRRTWTDEPLDRPGAPLPEVGPDFVADVGARLERRLPSAAGAAPVGGHAGMLDMTPDGLPLVGPTAVPGLWLCCGWSGTGFKTAPAVGESLAGWLAGGRAPAELLPFDPGRRMGSASQPRSPH
ncbi:MAG: FAD-binding oxidoreductase [Solirubrobacterales bacterium]